MDEGTEICASRAGVVVTVKEDSNKGGADISYMDFANRITVLNADGSFADYAHLRQNGAIVEKGDEVKAGQLIGYSGNTGWSTRPHLHFQVYKAVKFGTETLPVKFLNGTGEVIELVEQVGYQAFHR
jgi:murein DD-endopeptidase MepM/ murein hydrolase activator NlpD